MNPFRDINPVPEESDVPISDLKLATGADLNRVVDGKKEKAIGITFFANFGTRKQPQIRKVKLTGDQYQTEWVTELLGRERIYVRKTIDNG